MTTAPFYTKALLLSNDGDLPYALPNTTVASNGTNVQTNYTPRCSTVGDYAIISFPKSTTFTGSTVATTTVSTLPTAYFPINAPAYGTAMMEVNGATTSVTAEVSATGVVTFTNSATLSGTCGILPCVLIYELS